jgi:hypothetical protein
MKNTSKSIVQSGIFLTNSCNLEEIFLDDPLTALDTFHEKRFRMPTLLLLLLPLPLPIPLDI